MIISSVCSDIGQASFTFLMLAQLTRNPSPVVARPAFSYAVAGPRQADLRVFVQRKRVGTITGRLEN